MILLFDNYERDKSYMIFNVNKCKNNEIIKDKFKNMMTFDVNFDINNFLFYYFMKFLFKINKFLRPTLEKLLNNKFFETKVKKF